MKKLTLSALAVAVVCIAACTKDNSKSTSPAVQIKSVSSSSLASKDTIHPAVRARVATPTASKDTIHP